MHRQEAERRGEHRGVQAGIWSGKRDSNPQPSAWKADALAVELFPHNAVVPRQSTCLLQPRQIFKRNLQPSDDGRGGGGGWI